MHIKTRINSKKTSAHIRVKWRSLGRTQSDVARELKISQPQLSRLLKGKFARPTSSLKKLCVFLDAKCIYHSQQFSLSQFPAIQQCLAEIMDGTKSRERSLVQLLKIARKFP